MNIRNIRKAAGLTQADLADKIGINRATLSKYESGDIEPSISMLVKISNALDVSINELCNFNNTVNTSSIGERIKEARRQAGLTQKKLGELCGIAEPTIRRYELGKLNPKIETLQKIADALDVPVNELYDISTQPKSAPTLTKKDERDIARDLEKIMEQLDASGDLMFDGDPMSEEARESIRAAMKLGLEAAKLKNKERFTPKKYRKD